MIHLRLDDTPLFFIMKIEFYLYRVYFVFIVYYKMTIKYNPSYIFELYCQSFYCLSWCKLLKSFFQSL